MAAKTETDRSCSCSYKTNRRSGHGRDTMLSQPWLLLLSHRYP